MKVSLLIDGAFLKRIDHAADHVGETRSGFIAGAALQRIRATFVGQVSDADVARVLGKVDLSKPNLAELVKEAIER